jgi:hypothetical protein
MSATQSVNSVRYIEILTIAAKLEADLWRAQFAKPA